ncbi:MAG: cyclopropane fatty acyl phospholipid synthase [Parcubacteria group bacterium]|nr:cyclopropane fatty acyl phospholipid synthase [Parcubacteria group bacterium]
MANKYTQLAGQILEKAGIEINGSKPWDIQVHNERLYERVFRQGILGLGEAYMDGWWDAEALDQFFFKVIKAKIRKNFEKNIPALLLYLKSRLTNMQSKNSAVVVAREHYNLSVKLYTSFLDPYNQYTCGYFKDTDDLNVAQKQKLELICKKLQLKSGDRVLDIGCGWGGFAKYAAEHYKVSVTGITISKEQLVYAEKFTKGLPIELYLQDYRDLSGQFDKILICGMIEHVGYKNYRNLIEIVNKHLVDSGLFLLHTIGSNNSATSINPWTNKYIFPNSMIPSLAQLAKAFEGLFIVEDWHNFGSYYDPTLMAWFRNFDRNWSQIKTEYDDRFYRMWKYYLLSSAGVFRARGMQLWQIVLSKNGVQGEYKSIR